jgi:hypothetical protein
MSPDIKIPPQKSTAVKTTPPKRPADAPRCKPGRENYQTNYWPWLDWQWLFEHRFDKF